MSYITMKEWVINELYSELCQMPLWTLSAFGSLQEEEILKQYDIRNRLIKYLVLKHIDKVPKSIYDDDFKHNWSITDFEECVKAAVKKCKDRFSN